MTELLADLDHRVVDGATSREYFVNVVGEQMSDGTWEGWLEFVPLDDTEPVLTRTETRQHMRADVVQWANTVTEAYIQAAFDRAIRASEPVGIPRRVATPLVRTSTRAAAALDPFEHLRSGEESLRARLQPLTRAELLAIIANYNLDPARLSLARLTDRQLVTFIVTATEVQHKLGKG